MTCAGIGGCARAGIFGMLLYMKRKFPRIKRDSVIECLMCEVVGSSSTDGPARGCGGPARYHEY